MHKEKSHIAIRIADLMQGIHEFDFTCNASDFEGWQLAEAGFTRDIKISVVVEKSENEITVAINTSTAADFTCDICLAPISRTLAGSLKLCYLFCAPVEKAQDWNEEYRFLDKNAESIDLTGDVCETLLLSLPLKVVCTDNPHCKLFGSDEKNERSQADEISSWQESLEQLKNKYR
ncbi:MAG: DUF177 domain-containing protein [Chlorobiaceae bacterium]|nr:DUF177 domain-containing protein [Chlorobiaceae bacterium]